MTHDLRVAMCDKRSEDGMTKREQVLAALAHREPEVIPNNEGFFDSPSSAKFVPRFKTKDPLKWRLQYLEFMDNAIASVAGSNVALGSKVIRRWENHHILEWENGSKWLIQEEPFQRKYIEMPIKSRGDVDKMPLPDPDDPKRYQGIAEKVKFFKQEGYFTMASIKGFFSGLWYHCIDYEDLMINFLRDPEFIKAIQERFSGHNLKVAENLLGLGVDAIYFPDDMGGTDRMFFSPKIYERLFWPWHRRLADLCHRYRAYLYMHSHGYIMPIVGLIADAGVDILNPVGPTDNMDLAKLKKEYGQRLTFCGGITKFLAELSKEELEAHIEEACRIGSDSGGFITASEGGIPYTMTQEKFNFYLATLKKYRIKYGRAAG